MPRKNNSKQTVERIISISSELFIEKGYDKTSMQDIVDALGMSKGAIFHHFKSKEDILHSVMNKHCENTEETIYKWLDEMKGVNARETISMWLDKTLQDFPEHPLDSVWGVQFSSPQMIVANMQDIVNRISPRFQRLVQEGLVDGSITTQFPQECAQVFFLLLNTWCDTTIFKCDVGGLQKRLKFLQHTMKQLGMDVISDGYVEGFIASFVNYENENKEVGHGKACH